MAIELHHLNTHGMMEQACDVLDGVVRLKERIAELEKLNHDLCERVTENDEIRLHWEEIEQTRAENERMKARIAELERMDTEHTLQIAKMNGYISHLEDVLEHHGIVLPKGHEFVMEEMAEAFAAYEQGDKAHALQELAKCGAMILRIMETIEKEVVDK